MFWPLDISTNTNIFFEIVSTHFAGILQFGFGLKFQEKMNSKSISSAISCDIEIQFLIKWQIIIDIHFNYSVIYSNFHVLPQVCKQKNWLKYFAK